jgi:hypothetical protein
MRRIRPLLFLTFGVLLCASFIVTRSDAQPNTVKQIVPGVWFREGDIFGQGHCNNVIIEMQDLNSPLLRTGRMLIGMRKICAGPAKYGARPSRSFLRQCTRII